MTVTEDEKAAKARDAALQGALMQIEREFGKGTVMRMGDEGAQIPPSFWASASTW